MSGQSRAPLRLGIGGLGAIGLVVAKRVDEGLLPGFELAAVSARDTEKAKRVLSGFRKPPHLTGLAGLAEAADVVVEGLPSSLFADIDNDAWPDLLVANGFMTGEIPDDV